MVQANGKILVGGFFDGTNSIGGQPRNFIARLDATTGLADSFNPNPSGSSVLSIAIEADGKVLAAGAFITLAPNGGTVVTRNRIARLEIDGRLDQTLVDLEIPVGKFGLGQVTVTAVQPDGKILIGGNFYEILGTIRRGVARLNTDGTLDTAFNPDVSTGPPNSIVNSVAVLPDGRVLVGGDFTLVSGQTRSYLVRLDPTTGLADSFNPNANGPVGAIAVQADGKILVGGGFSNIGGEARNGFARLDPTTGLVDSFNPLNNSGIASIAVQVDGKILVAGGFTSIGGQTRRNVARLDPATGLPDSFNPNPNPLSICRYARGADGRKGFGRWLLRQHGWTKPQ